MAILDVAVERVLPVRRDRDVESQVGVLRPDRSADLVGLADWRGDVALELWVEADVSPARVRLAGRLDSATLVNLTQVIQEILDDGTREVELCTDGLRVIDSSALGALADIEHLVSGYGGNLVRVGPSAGPFGKPAIGGNTVPARRTWRAPS